MTRGTNVCIDRDRAVMDRERARLHREWIGRSRSGKTSASGEASGSGTPKSRMAWPAPRRSTSFPTPATRKAKASTGSGDEDDSDHSAPLNLTPGATVRILPHGALSMIGFFRHARIVVPRRPRASWAPIAHRDHLEVPFRVLRG